MPLYSLCYIFMLGWGSTLFIHLTPLCPLNRILMWNMMLPKKISIFFLNECDRYTHYVQYITWDNFLSSYWLYYILYEYLAISKQVFLSSSPLTPSVCYYEWYKWQFFLASALSRPLQIVLCGWDMCIFFISKTPSSIRNKQSSNRQKNSGTLIPRTHSPII